MSDKTCGIEIQKDTFISLDQKGRDGVLYDYLDVIYKRVSKLDKDATTDSKKAVYVGGIAGFFGGASTVLAYLFSRLFTP
jgi:hypothetical protein